jgi:hypothetical protein
VNVKNEGKGIAHNPSFDWYFLRGQQTIYSGSDQLQPIGPGDRQNIYINTSGQLPNDGILRLYWKGSGSDGAPFNASREFQISSIKLVNDYL